MQTQYNVEQLESSCVGRRRAVAAFDGGQVTSELCRSSPSSGPRRCGDLTSTRRRSYYSDASSSRPLPESRSNSLRFESRVRVGLETGDSTPACRRSFNHSALPRALTASGS